MKVLIIDDEKIVRTGLRKIIEEKSFDFIVIGEAIDGTDALLKVDSLKPDICIVDICMRRMNGVDFIREVRCKNQSIRFVVLSGYAEFQYAQNLIELGCSGYLTKPLVHVKLIEILNRLREEILIERQQNQRMLDLENTSRNIWEIKREQFLKHIATHGLSEECDLLSLYKLEWLRLPFCAAVVGVECCFDIIKKTLQIVLEEKNIDMYAIQDLSESECFLLIPAEYPYTDIVSDCCRRIQKATGKIAVSGVCDDVMDIKYAIDYAKAAMQSGFSNHTVRIHHYKDINSKIYKDFERHESRIKDDILNGGCSNLSEYMEEMLDELQMESVHMNTCFVLLCRLYLSVWTRLNEAARIDVLEQIPTYHKFEKKIYSFHLFNSMCEYVRSVYSIIESVMSADVDRTHRKAVQQAKRFIAENYYYDISLTDIADHVALNPSYFSYLFKRETGQTYMRYLIQYRIEEAKNLLMNTSLKVYEIGEQIGYSDPKYFSRIFRQVTGVTPGKFRENNNVLIY